MSIIQTDQPVIRSGGKDDVWKDAGIFWYDNALLLWVAASSLTPLPVNAVAEFGEIAPITHWSPADGAVAFTTAVTITCAGFPFVVDDANCRVMFVFYRPAAGSWTRLHNGLDGVSMSAAANVITVTGAGNPFAAGDEYMVGVCQQTKAIGLPGAAVPAHATMPGVAYNAVPPAVASGQMARRQGNAFGFAESAAHIRALGADSVSEIAPPVYDGQFGTALAAGVLPAAGALTARNPILVGGFKKLVLFFSYQQGAAGGTGLILVELAITPPGVAIQWGREAIQNTPAFVPGADVTTNIQRHQWLYDPTAAGVEIPILFFDISRVQEFSVSVAEVGAIANPGTSAVYYGLSH